MIPCWKPGWKKPGFLFRAFLLLFQLKKFQLLWCVRSLCRFGLVEYFHHAELLIGNGENNNIPRFGQKAFHPFCMYIGVFPAGTTSHINGVLEHGKTILNKALPEQGCSPAFSPCFGGQIKKNHNPHNSICI